MSYTEDILKTLPDRAGYGRSSQIYTPVPIAKDMVNILPDQVWNKNTTFLDICCKSGVFLHEIYLKLMETESLIQEFPDKADRRNHILKNQLYGISPDQMCQLMSTRTVYGTIGCESNIISFGDNYLRVMQNTDKRFLYNRLKEEFNKMNFDVVIGNPPYNKGMDLDFVDLGYKVQNKYVCMITPAKWQTTADDYSGCASKNINYKQFREKYVPHMSYVCFYPDCVDVFSISQSDGITYYMLDKDIHTECVVENKCKINKYLNSCMSRNISNRQTLWNVSNDIIEYLADYKRFKFRIPSQAEYLVITNSQLAKGGGARGGVGIFNNEGNFQCVGVSDIYTPQTQVLAPNASGTTFASNSKAECESFISWLNTKFTRFFVACNISKLGSILTDDYFRFVPAPPSGKFDHIYTDAELYKAFNLPQKYIEVIESVIKERK